MEQKYKSENNSTQIAVLEKETNQETVKQSTAKEIAAAKLNLFSADVLRDFEYHTQKAKQVQERSAEVAPKQDILQQTKQQTQEIQEIEPEIQEETLEQQAENEVEDKVEEEIDQALFGTIDEIESTGEKEIEEEIKAFSKPNKKGFAFRFKLMTGVFCLLIALFGGWVIGNAVQISSTSAQIAQSTVDKEVYDANLLSYLSKISQLDNWNENNVNSDSALIPIEEVIPITPTPLEDPTSYERESNWFDKICNWISNLFGG